MYFKTCFSCSSGPRSVSGHIVKPLTALLEFGPFPVSQAAYGFGYLRCNHFPASKSNMNTVITLRVHHGTFSQSSPNSAGYKNFI